MQDAWHCCQRVLEHIDDYYINMQRTERLSGRVLINQNTTTSLLLSETVDFTKTNAIIQLLASLSLMRQPLYETLISTQATHYTWRRNIGVPTGSRHCCHRFPDAFPP